MRPLLAGCAARRRAGRGLTVVPVIQPRALELLVRDFETERGHQVERHARRRARARDVARVLRDLGVDEHDAQPMRGGGGGAAVAAVGGRATVGRRAGGAGRRRHARPPRCVDGRWVRSSERRGSVWHQRARGGARVMTTYPHIHSSRLPIGRKLPWAGGAEHVEIQRFV